MNLVRVRVGRKWRWILAEIEYEDLFDPIGYTPVEVPSTFQDIEEVVEWKEELAFAVWHLTKYELYRGKLREYKR